MTSGTSRRPDRAARTARPEREHVLFVHAHPDDESIVTGGTIAKLVRDGVPVTVLTCTRGSAAT
ncbi:1D-myo-inositol 2-acetamido-2-deoxy-alpha-D-glucopyranoside deacetylase [Clavibacter michiganensis subsp. michiganensis]|uniref:1D-myo-inositol 2-acetamido-2-deoxy-alpha-D-glucopyranoside deacetylase n=1 Tax=Clavibacter michiganensis subsp. michiganensis TaxID=33013 RepID=A0A251XIR8_CLAMM|nr:PIG-L family deacetylase [Clavibacter michiganensis]OUD86692.1 1D-myo-inositol 2-acetamido-2-deoxy-alpha-D-glucopyranoside deacetylase [Clavibacter michiganensis subsp. michiganensis]OUE03435.1 1D-myo-inositol 2-acetamido-2-deoxy-alpha-D-glucopyranoside deacetylase [Clavibacter michiganensis subsp. michiganensis]OUE16838.1 1D-myo-inositol 2-acetamido-2-deoxy-alpha-D-glucopyranoside deacetylase [Clavibacter michiganensis subsp. michiganensis]